MEITKREIITSITIIAIMLLLGIFISGRISEYQMESNEAYNKAVRIDTTEMFKYGMSTRVGNAFVYGDLIAIDPVSYPEIKGTYLSVKKIKEVYTRHTRTVTTTVNGKTRTKTEVYWTWDTVDTDYKEAKKVKFCNVEFNTSQFDLPRGNHITTIRESSHVRYQYSGYPIKTTGTIFAFLADNNIGKDVSFYKDKTIDVISEELQSGEGMLIIFWVVWVGIIIAVVCVFYARDNYWLE